MVKRVFIIHGWGGNPLEAWFPWLKEELEKRKFNVVIPTMPETAKPTISHWVNFLKKTVGKIDEETYFVGHSIGCQTILRYLEKIKDPLKIGGAVLVAPWFNLIEESYENEEERKIALPWIKKKIKFDLVLNHCENFVALFSDNDPFVPLGDALLFEEKLHARTIIAYGKGHFDGASGMKEFPLVLDELLNISSKTQ